MTVKVRLTPRPTLRPAFASLLASASTAWTTLDELPAADPARGKALARWTQTCLTVVTAVSNRTEAEALDGLDGWTTDDWIRFMLSLGLPQD
jgi:hypothetical protein